MAVKESNPVQPKTIDVAIIGGGPGGLATAITLGRLPFINWTLYEKKPQISETGGGISLQRHTWRMLELMGAAQNISDDDFFRPPDGHTVQHRRISSNARTGELLSQGFAPKDTPLNQRSCRMIRPKLQGALLKQVDQSKIKTGKKLVEIERLASGRLRVVFADGFEDEVDLLVGADGIRSAVRQFAFPTHSISYIGQSAYRTLISTASVDAHLLATSTPTVPKGPIFWHNVGGKYVFTCPLGGDVFEVTARIRRSPDSQDQVSWGQPFDLHQLLPEYTEFCPTVRAILALAAEGQTQEFAMFSGPRLESCVGFGSVALLGDASHPLSGAFGAGAGFALEDAYTLATALEWAFGRGGGETGEVLAEALGLYDRVRSPHYKGLYDTLDRMGGAVAALAKEGLPVDEEIAERVRRSKDAGNDWMYYHKADEVVRQAILEMEAETEGAGKEDRVVVGALEVEVGA
ncbi:hypothetical protein B0T19DRAFT_357199 [Cercophora scortea]|uniref:FAD-binding domain-containing protein n=1 Tax=Cercophora scortea TaxID=314031 RepID=A0AAE0MEA9_9PEZI|nr:hypothetical protein B0T19DRAFT_357199 [Cercophora scortea]